MTVWKGCAGMLVLSTQCGLVPTTAMGSFRGSPLANSLVKASRERTWVQIPERYNTVRMKRKLPLMILRVLLAFCQAPVWWLLLQLTLTYQGEWFSDGFSAKLMSLYFPVSASCLYLHLVSRVSLYCQLSVADAISYQYVQILLGSPGLDGAWKCCRILMKGLTKTVSPFAVEASIMWIFLWKSVFYKEIGLR